MLRLLAVFLLITDHAHAGAWPREPAHHFAAVALRFSDRAVPGAPRQRLAIYYEYGLSERLTIGLDIGSSAAGLDKALFFAQIPIGRGNGPLRFSANIGIGTIAGRPALRPALSVGRGFSIGQRSGWAEMTTTAEIDLKSGTMGGKLDLTIGLSLTDKSKVYGQIFASDSQTGPPDIRVEGSFATRLRDGLMIDIGLSRGIAPINDTRLKIGLWRDF